MKAQAAGALDYAQFEEVMAINVVSPPPTETDMLKQLIGPENASRQGKPNDVIAGLIKVVDDAEQRRPPVCFDGTQLPW